MEGPVAVGESPGVGAGEPGAVAMVFRERTKQMHSERPVCR